MTKHIICKNIARYSIGAIIVFLVSHSTVFAASYWEITSVDTMKFSRDISREPDILTRIGKYVEKAASLKSGYISVATPYDEEFYPVLATWVSEIRKNGKKVWFRGNWSGWEGWFDYPKFVDYAEHHRKTEAFIKAHKELFVDGDIFTPAPEAENGGFGDPRTGEEKNLQYQAFLRDSFDACKRGSDAIGVAIRCGYFSMNGDVARENLTKELVSHMGGVVVIDHFVKSPEKLVQDIQMYHDKYDAKIVLGEVGGPIPDIHGEMDEFQQAEYMNAVFNSLVSVKDIVLGVNYWTVFGGSTRVFENDLRERKVADTIRSFYAPTKLTGVVTNQFGARIADATVTLFGGNFTTSTDKTGTYTILESGNYQTLTITKGDSYVPYSIDFTPNGRDVEVRNVVIEEKTTGIVDTVYRAIFGLFSRISSIFMQN